MQLFDLTGSVSVKTDDAEKSLKRIEGFVTQLGESINQSAKKFEGWANTIKKSSATARSESDLTAKRIDNTTAVTTALVRATGNIVASTAKAVGQYKSAREATTKMANATEKATEKTGGFAQALKNVAGGAKDMISHAINIGKSVIDAGNQFAETTTNIKSMSQTMGMSTKGFQEWDFIMSQSGASMETMKSGMDQMMLAVGDLESGIGAGADSFERLGLSAASMGEMSNEEIFESTLSALQGISDETERATLANQIFGESSQELSGVLSMSGESLESMKTQAGELGVILGEDAINSGASFKESMGQLEASIQGIGMSFMATLMPTLQTFLEFVVANMPMIQKMLGEAFGVLEPILASLVPIFLDLANQLLPIVMDLFMNIATNVLPPFMDVLKKIAETVLPPLLDIFRVLVDSVLPPIMDVLTLLFEEVLPPLLEQLGGVIEEIMPPLIELFQSFAENILPVLVDVFGMIIETVMPPLMDLFGYFAKTVLPPLVDLFNEIAKNVIPFVAEKFMWVANAIIPILTDVFEGMKPIIEGAMNAVAAVIDIVTSLIKGDWEGVWNGIQDFFGSILDTIVAAVEVFTKPFEEVFTNISDTVLGIWDGIVGGIKGAINFIIESINGFIRGINEMKIPDWVPGVGGFGFSIGEIPLLAEGGKIQRSGRVIVGEEGPEMLDLPFGAKVTPLDKARGAMFGPRAFEGAMIMDDYGVDQLMDRVMDRLSTMGVN